MFKNLFKKDVYVDIFSPTSGDVFPIEEIPDDVFAGKIVGDGFGVRPSNNEIFSPVSGEVKVIFPTLNSIAIRTEEGLEVLIHVGINTTELEDSAFKPFIKLGDRVEVGQLLMSFNEELLGDELENLITPVVFTNMEIVKSVNIEYGRVEVGENLGKVNLK